jgi:hypothetical protein
MQLRNDTVPPVCADLYTRIERLEEDWRTMTLPALHEAVESLRATAMARQLLALEGIAHAFERSIARNRQGTAFGLYFDQLKLATGCMETDETDARETMLAAISVRMAG